MKVWLDAQLPPALCGWLGVEYGLEAIAVRDLGLREALDSDIFDAAAAAGAVVFTKTADFAALVIHRGAPPQVLWVICGNTTNAGLREFFKETLRPALDLLAKGEPARTSGANPLAAGPRPALEHQFARDRPENSPPTSANASRRPGKPRR